MALGFGRKKATDDVPASSAPSPLPADSPVSEEAAPIAAHAPSSPPNDDLDAFDLDTFADSNAGALNSVSAPTQNANSPVSGSAFDFPDEVVAAGAPLGNDADPPDFDQLYAIEQAKFAKSAAPAPFVPPTATIQEPATPFYEPQVPVVAESEPAPKKKLPLVPVLGALGILALAGTAATYFSQSAPDAKEPVTTVSAPAAPQRPAPPIKPAAPTQGVKIKPVPVVVDPLPADKNPVRPGIAPASARMAQLKALWKRGAAAKHRGDYAAARRYWNQGLKIQPDNVGFRESIAKLPR